MKVSVIIPVYNVKPYLERCVQSVLGQTYKDIEMILVDDGSTDGSGQLCDELAAKHGQIRVIHQENQGLSVARNVGIRHAVGEYIAFIDSDDKWLMDQGLATLIDASNEGTADLIIFKNVDIWRNNYCTATADYDLYNISLLPDAQSVFSYLVMTQQFRMSACFLLVRRQLLIEHDILFPEGLVSEDVHWSLLLWQYAQTVAIKNLNFYGYYHHEMSLSTTASIKVYESYDKIFSYWTEKCQKGCVNAAMIRIYLANMWVNRGYQYYRLKGTEKKKAFDILQKHTGLLQYAVTPKAKRVARLVKIFNVKTTAILLGIYWRIRILLVRHVI